MLGKTMTFEEERIAIEKHDRLNELVRSKLDGIKADGKEPSIDDMVAAINEASQAIDPAPDGLIYEMD